MGHGNRSVTFQLPIQHGGDPQCSIWRGVPYVYSPIGSHPYVPSSMSGINADSHPEVQVQPSIGTGFAPFGGRYTVVLIDAGAISDQEQVLRKPSNGPRPASGSYHTQTERWYARHPAPGWHPMQLHGHSQTPDRIYVFSFSLSKQPTGHLLWRRERRIGARLVSGILRKQWGLEK